MRDPDKNAAQGQNVGTEMTPEARVAITKARRSFAMAMGTLLLGFMAIGFAIVYRVTRDAPASTLTEMVILPTGADIISAVLTNNGLNITYRLDGTVTLSQFNATTGALNGSVIIAAE